jgi:hypothetical protein
MNETKKNIEYTLPESFYNDSDNLGNLFEVYFNMELRRTHRQIMGDNNGIHKVMEVVAE